MEEYKQSVKKAENRKKEKAEGNLANFQFVNAINNLMYDKYDTNCKTFSLKDKANCRKMIQSAIKNTSRCAKVVDRLKSAFDEIKNDNEDVRLVMEENEEMEKDIGGLIKRMEECQEVKRREGQKRQELLEKMDGLRVKLNESLLRRDDKEEKVRQKCGETVRILERARDEKKKQLEYIEMQLEMKKVKESVLIDCDSQQESIELVRMENEIKSMDIKLEQLKYASKEYVKEKEREYERIKGEWSEMMEDRARKLDVLEREKEVEKERATRLRRMKEQLKYVEQEEEMHRFDIECEIRNRKYGIGETLATENTGPNQDGDGNEEMESSSRGKVDEQYQMIVEESKEKLGKMHKLVTTLFEIHLKKAEMQQKKATGKKRKSSNGTGSPADGNSYTDIGSNKDILTLRSQAERLMNELSRSDS